jgi:DNA-binding MarR family transcriptional regulator
MPSSQSVDDPDGPVAQVERALVSVRRSQRRRAVGGPALAGIDEALSEPIRLGVLGVLDAVVEAPADGEITVGLVADRLGLDPSRASRLVAESVDAGLLARRPSKEDGRRTCLELTGKGGDVCARVQSVRRTYVSDRMSGWTAHEQRTFAKLLRRFVDQPDTDTT